MSRATSQARAAATTGPATVDMKLEAVIIPVAMPIERKPSTEDSGGGSMPTSRLTRTCASSR
jgi:hypothetical protein